MFISDQIVEKNVHIRPNTIKKCSDQTKYENKCSDQTKYKSNYET